jgi:hypothetical protein
MVRHMTAHRSHLFTGLQAGAVARILRIPGTLACPGQAR